MKKESSNNSAYIVSSLYDKILFITAPLIAVAIAVIGYTTDTLLYQETFFGTERTWISFFISFWTFAHLWAVFFRSHLNLTVFRQFKWRFTLVPLCLFLLFSVSIMIQTIAIAIAFYWDVYHTSKQNYGFCRIYDSRIGNVPTIGRRLDSIANHLLYIGPIIGSYSLLDHLKPAIDNLAVHFPKIVFVIFLQVLPKQSILRLCLIIIGVLFFIYYILSYRKMSKEGYKVSRQKVSLLCCTGITSIFAWGFLPPMAAFFVANFYHGLQYFGIVWAKEKTNIRKTFRLNTKKHGSKTALFLFCIILIVLGLFHVVLGSDRIALALFTVVSLMHFWYDGFIWSVRKGLSFSR